jgi:hypothetical protein
LNNAEQASFSAFQAVLSAEASGANISSLLTQLNVAGASLTKAKAAFNSNNYDETISYANSCLIASNSVESQANQLRLDYTAQQNSSSTNKVIFSIIVILVICVGSFFVWRLFRKVYLEHSLRMKPEVISNEP